MCARVCRCVGGFTHVFSVRADVVGRLRIIRTFSEPFADGSAVCGGVIHLSALKTGQEDRKNKNTLIL